MKKPVNNNDIDALFQEGLKNHIVLPPEHIWDSIEKELQKNKKKKTILFLWRGAAAAVVTGIILSTFFYLHNQPSSSVIANQTGNVITDEPHKNTEDTNTLQNQSDKNIFSHDAIKPTLMNNETSFANNNNSLQKTIHQYTKTNQVKTVQENTYDSLKSISSNPAIPLLCANQIDVHSIFIDYNIDNLNLKDPNIDLLNSIFNNEEIASKTENKSTKLSIGGLVSPSYAYRYETNTESASSEAGFTSVSGGFNFKIKTSHKLEFETGLIYAQAGQDFTNSSSSMRSSLIYGDDMTVLTNDASGKYQNSLGTINHTETEVNTEVSLKSIKISTATPTKVKQRLDYIEVPFIAKYKLLDTKYDISVLSGLSSNFLVGNSAYLVSSGSKQDLGGTSGINSVSFSATMGFGFQTPITKSIDFNLEPRIKYFLNSISGTTSYKPYSIGVFTGISYTF